MTIDNEYGLFVFSTWIILKHLIQCWFIKFCITCKPFILHMKQNNCYYIFYYQTDFPITIKGTIFGKYFFKFQLKLDSGSSALCARQCSFFVNNCNRNKLGKEDNEQIKFKNKFPNITPSSSIHLALHFALTMIYGVLQYWARRAAASYCLSLLLNSVLFVAFFFD